MPEVLSLVSIFSRIFFITNFAEFANSSLEVLHVFSSEAVQGGAIFYKAHLIAFQLVFTSINFL
jgi:hypothetical protein